MWLNEPSLPTGMSRSGGLAMIGSVKYDAGRPAIDRHQPSLASEM